ncbi:MAG: putative peptide modification system cyclase [Dokdonella sp.]|uniref:putative peptide modification system cyclase n=1 Tax=Dokdonella sp. TaxID=2291710 RepID=UPI003264894C
MNALAQSVEPAPLPVSVPLLRTLVLCDLVDSTALVERMGDQRATDLFRKHDRLARALVHRHGGREIDKTDGFLMMFDRPVQAVAFALDYQRALTQLNDNEKTSLASRIGIHVGDVLTWDNAPDDIAKGAKPVEVEGLVKPIASRLMQLALPNQILLSGVAHSLAHRAQGELGEQLATVRWRTHGRYRFKGIPDPIPVFEVGEEGYAPLKPPPWSGKAHRELPFWRRPATLGIEIGLLVIAIAIPSWYLLTPAPAIAFANRDWVVVGDLKNLTGEASFDEAIDTAFRIGLEQSRYVNVLSDLKTRETIKLMQKDPDTIKLDRAVGSEVAIRDGARALILPTIAEVGGRVRVTAEVVDPNTQTTVWSESADGVGSDSVLPSLDRVNQQLRVRLGEALATVSKDSRPLDKVATKNLDALRAYSLAEHAYTAGDMSSSMSFYRQAIKLDPEFVLARVGLARSLVVSDRKDEASAELELAAKSEDRLPPRESLVVEAWQASLRGSPLAALEKWKLASSLYPDFFAARGLYAYFAWQFANRYDDETIDAAKAASSPKNPYAPASLLLLGTLYVANDRFDEANVQFDLARKGGMAWNVDYTFADAAQRKFDAAQGTLAKWTSSGVAARDIDVAFRKVLIAADRGTWNQVWPQLDEMKHNVMGLGVNVQHRLALLDSSLRIAIAPDTLDQKEMRALFTPIVEALTKASDTNRADVQLDALFAAYLAARQGDVNQAAEILAAARPRDESYPVLSKLFVIADSERLRASGNADQAIRSLKAAVDGAELYITHVALMDAYASAKDYTRARAQARWLADHRGRAYAEYDPNRVPFDVIQSTLALLDAAEYAQAGADKAGAQRSLEEFKKNWPNADELPFVKNRIKKL